MTLHYVVMLWRLLVPLFNDATLCRYALATFSTVIQWRYTMSLCSGDF